MVQDPAFTADTVAAIKAEYLALGGQHDNNYTGCIAKENQLA